MSLLLLTLASDPYDRPGALDALASALRGGRGSSTELAPRIPWWCFRRHQAVSRDGKTASYEREATGSNPVAPTR